MKQGEIKKKKNIGLWKKGRKYQKLKKLIANSCVCDQVQETGTGMRFLSLNSFFSSNVSVVNILQVEMHVR